MLIVGRQSQVVGKVGLKGATTATNLTGLLPLVDAGQLQPGSGQALPGCKEYVISTPRTPAHVLYGPLASLPPNTLQ